MAVAYLQIDGQERPIDQSLVSSADNYAKLRKVLARIFPLIGNATISHKQVGERTIVTVVKRPDQKGAAHLRPRREAGASDLERITGLLDAEPAAENPALRYSQRLRLKMAAGEIDLRGLKRRRAQLAQAITRGEEEVTRVRSIITRLDQAEAVPLREVPAGF